MKHTEPRLDWLTLSIPFRVDNRVMLEGYRAHVEEHLLALFRANRWLECFESDNAAAPSWHFGHSVRPYPESLRNDKYNVIIGYGGSHEVCTVWLSGTALQHLAAQGELEATLQHITDCKYSVSRLDLAIDFNDVAATPTALAAQLLATAKSKTQSWQTSKTGTTLTIGSRKSARYARLYKYTDRDDRPHARLEIELKGKTAQAALWKIQNFDIERVFFDNAGKMGMNLTPPPAFAPLPTLALEHKNIPNTGTRTAWLNAQVIPAIRAMIAREEVTLLQIVEALTA